MGVEDGLMVGFRVVGRNVSTFVGALDGISVGCEDSFFVGLFVGLIVG